MATRSQALKPRPLASSEPSYLAQPAGLPAPDSDAAATATVTVHCRGAIRVTVRLCERHSESRANCGPPARRVARPKGWVASEPDLSHYDIHDFKSVSHLDVATPISKYEFDI